jgi:hypothetical protein
MNRHELEHLIRASGAITEEYEFVVIGSQSILGKIPYPDPEFKMSAEADIYPRYAPELAEKIEGVLGEGSEFHLANGFYAQGVGPETAVLPQGWEERHGRCRTGIPTASLAGAWTLKTFSCRRRLQPGRRDQEFCTGLLRRGYVTLERCLELAPSMPLEPPEIARLVARIKRWAK